MTGVVKEQSALLLARVAFTGRLASMTRAEAHEVVKAARGTPVATVSRRISVLVVGMDGWPLLPDGTISRKLERAEALRRQGAPIRIVSEADFLEMAGLEERRPALRKSYTAERVGELVGVPESTLRRWELMGLVRSSDGLYDFQDIVSLQTIAALVAAGVAAPTIARSVRGLASVLPGTERPLAQLSIVIEHRGALLADFAGCRIAPDGQLVIGFDRETDAPTAPVAAVAAVAAAADTADDWFERGAALEEAEGLAAATGAYRAALALRPHFPEAQFNLGNVLRALGRLDGAEERYRSAIEQDPDFALAWYNLGDLLEETGRIDEAITCLRRSLGADRDFADAHYNLALCLERAGRRDDAAAHWRAYLALDSASPWADEARSHLGSTGRAS